MSDFTTNNCQDEKSRLRRVDKYINSLSLKLDCKILNHLDIGINFFTNDYWCIEDYPNQANDFNRSMKIDVLRHIEDELNYKIYENNDDDLPFPKIEYINALKIITDELEGELNV